MLQIFIQMDRTYIYSVIVFCVYSFVTCLSQGYILFNLNKAIDIGGICLHMRWDSGIAHPLPLSCVPPSPISIKCHIQCIITNWSVFVIRLQTDMRSNVIYISKCDLVLLHPLSFPSSRLHTCRDVQPLEYVKFNGSPENGKITLRIQTGMDFFSSMWREGSGDGVWVSQRTSKLCYANWSKLFTLHLIQIIS